MPEQKDKISDNFNVVINKIQMSPQEETHFSQTFINRLISPLSKIFTNNFSLILSLFCVIPARVELYDVEIVGEVYDEEMKQQLQAISNRLKLYGVPQMTGFTAFAPDTRDVYITLQLFKDKELSVADYTTKVLNEHSLFLGFVYMHEIMHIFNRDQVAAPSMYTMAQRILKERGAAMSLDQIHEIVNIAQDYFINGVLIKKNQSFDVAQIRNEWFYKSEFDVDNITNRDILEYILNNAKISQQRFGENSNDNQDTGDSSQNQDDSQQNGQGSTNQDNQGNQSNQNNQQDNKEDQSSQNNQQPNKESDEQQDSEEQSEDNQQENKQTGGLSGTIQTVEIDGRKYTTIKLDNQIILKPNDSKDGDKSNSNQSIDPATAADLIADIINDTISKVRGIGSAEMLAALGIPLEIKMDWARKLRKRVLYLYDEMNKQGRTWTRPNIFTRHIATLPGDERKGKYPMLYVMVDSSGSMSDVDLRKINYVLKELNTRGFGITLLLHDYVLVKTEHFEPKSKEIKEFIKYRYSAGGTSHKEPFEYIEDNVDKKDYRKAVVLILSDMYSDIDEIYRKYKWTSHIHTIGLVFSNSEYKLPFGETIVIN